MASPLRTAVRALRGELPARYSDSMRGLFFTRLWDHLRREGAVVLDAGGGRHPFVASRSELGPGATYVGLDAVPAELDAAPPGIYDETIAADVTDWRPELEGRFDAIGSMWLLEHVPDMQQTLDNFHGYLRPGGRLVALVSGGRSVIALGKRVLPERLGERLATAGFDARESHDVFPAHYDRCTAGALRELGTQWSAFEVLPLFRAADYLRFSRVLTALYLPVEELTLAREDRATHYLVVADH